MRTDWSVLLVLAALLPNCRATELSADATAAPGAVHWAGKDPAPVAETAPSRPRRLTVEQAVAEALARNRTVLQAREVAGISQTLTREARSALIPQIRGSGSYSRRDRPPRVVAEELGTTFTTGPRAVLGFDVVADFPIFGFGRHYHNYRAAVLAQRRSEADTEAAEADIAAAVTAAAFDILEARRSLEVARTTEAALDRQVKDARARLEAERVTREAVLEAEVERDQALRRREKIESSIPILRLVLNGLLGRPAESEIEVVDAPVTRAPVWDPKDLVEEALVRRPELRAAKLDLAAAERDLKATIAREFPELRGSVTYSASDNDFQSPKDVVLLGITLDIPLFTAGGRSARIRRARHDVERAALRLADLETFVRTEIAQAYRGVVESYKDIAVADRSRKKSEESLRIQRAKFNADRATSRDVLESTALLSDSSFGYVAALYNYNVALRELHRVRGADPRTSPLPPEGDAAVGNAKEE